MGNDLELLNFFFSCWKTYDSIKIILFNCELFVRGKFFESMLKNILNLYIYNSDDYKIQSLRNSTLTS